MHMPRHIDHLLRLALLWLGMLVATGVVAQQSPASSYYIDGEEVVFVFDVRQYMKALDLDTAGTLDFRDLGIEKVAISGSFNAWSEKGWRMNQTSEFTFELRKPLKTFNDRFPLEFRYLINGRSMDERPVPKSDSKSFDDDFFKGIYLLDLSVISVKDSGQVRFFLRGYPDARQVILSGNFNGWNEHDLQMRKVDDGWQLRADLPPGRYEYKFIVDGEWMHDPANPDRVKNEHDTYNSILYITTPVVFKLSGFPDAGRVYLAGSFNQWREKELSMIRVKDDWILSIPLAGGKHQYKFIVDGKWITDPDNPVIEDDGFGIKNSVLFVH